MSTYALANGAAGTPGYGSDYQIEFGNNGLSPDSTGWTWGDKWTLNITSTIGDFTLGAGDISGQSPTTLLVSYQRVWLAMQGSWFFSATNDPTGWEVEDIGAGNVDFDSQFGAVDNVVGFSPYQGLLAVFGAQSIQIWTISADPNQFARKQTLPNIGTESATSIQPYGEIDVFFLSKGGFRSLRVRDQSLNATVNDIGTPINSVIKAYTSVERQACVSIMEPDTHRYWAFIKDTIHVLSYFPELKIQSWSSFTPSYTTNILDGLSYSIGGLITGITVTPGKQYFFAKNDANSSIVNGSTVMATTQYFTAVGSSLNGNGPATQLIGNQILDTNTFTPETFVVYLGQIYVRTTTGLIYQYGGTNNQTYDPSILTVELPWLDHGKPLVKKQSAAWDGLLQGKWYPFCSMDPKTFKATGAITAIGALGSATAPATESDSSIDQGLFRYESIGTHIKIKMIGFSLSTSEPAKLSALIWRYNALTTGQ